MDKRSAGLWYFGIATAGSSSYFYLYYMPASGQFLWFRRSLPHGIPDVTRLVGWQAVGGAVLHGLTILEIDLPAGRDAIDARCSNILSGENLDYPSILGSGSVHAYDPGMGIGASDDVSMSHSLAGRCRPYNVPYR